MLKRLSIYFKEMFPFFERMLLAFIFFLEIYFMIFLNMVESDKTFKPFKLSNLGIEGVIAENPIKSRRKTLKHKQKLWRIRK